MPPFRACAKTCRACPPYGPIQIRFYLRKHAAEHVRRQDPGVGVVTRAMIAVVKFHVAGLVDRAVRERRRGAAQAERLQRRFVRNAAERHDRAQPWHRSQCRDEEWPAGVDLRRQRLVLRRHAVHRVADPAIDQRQPVVGPGLIDALGEAVFEQRGIEQVAGEIAGEGTPGAVGALQPRREADDQEPAVGIAERRHRRIEPVRFTRARCLAEAGEPRTERTIAIGFGRRRSGRRRAAGPVVLSRRNRRHRPSAPSWSRAAGIAARGGAARAGRDARTDRGRAWIAAPPDR